jgi:hypothetical protein
MLSLHYNNAMLEKIRTYLQAQTQNRRSGRTGIIRAVNGSRMSRCIRWLHADSDRLWRGDASPQTRINSCNNLLVAQRGQSPQSGGRWTGTPALMRWTLNDTGAGTSEEQTRIIVYLVLFYSFPCRCYSFALPSRLQWRRYVLYLQALRGPVAGNWRGQHNKPNTLKLRKVRNEKIRTDGRTDEELRWLCLYFSH